MGSTGQGNSQGETGRKWETTGQGDWLDEMAGRGNWLNKMGSTRR